MHSRLIRRRTLGGATPLLAGLVVQAISTYLVLVIAGRALGESRFGELSALYVLITSVATGLFLPVEQEIARRRGDGRGRGDFDRRLLVRSLRLALTIAALVVGVSVLWRGLSLRLLGQEPPLLAALCVALPGYACCFVTRGEFAGRVQLARYGVQLATEGVFRVVGAAVLAGAGVAGVGDFGWLFAAAPWVALGVSMWGWRGTDRRPLPMVQVPDNSSSDNRLSGNPGLVRSVALLVVSSLASQVLINSGPLVVALLAAPGHSTEVGAFLAALVIVRLPIFLFTAVQPSFLPAMAEHAAADRRADFVRLVRRVLTGSALLVVLSAILVVAAGPAIVRLLFGFTRELSRWIYLEMTLSVGLFLVAAILAQSLLGRAAHASITAGWLAGLVALGAGAVLGRDVVERASNGFLAGAVAATLVFGLLLVRSVRAWQSTAESVQKPGRPAE